MNSHTRLPHGISRKPLEGFSAVGRRENKEIRKMAAVHKEEVGEGRGRKSASGCEDERRGRVDLIFIFSVVPYRG